MINSNADFPQIIINSIPATELTNETVSEEELKQYARGVKELDCLWRRFHSNGMQYNTPFQESTAETGKCIDT
jgi:hypothetical protein